MASKAALALVLMLCCATVALATYDYEEECTCDQDCYDKGYKNTQCTKYKCKYGKCKSYNKPNGCSCNDGKKCTTGDKCYDGVCKGAPVKCYSKNQCKIAKCNPHSGQCETCNKPEGSPCSDGYKCTFNDKCCSGVCKGTTKVCHNKSPCTTTYCNPLTGQCKTKPANEGKACDDGNPHTCNDKCCSGVCKGTYKEPEPTYEEPTYEEPTYEAPSYNNDEPDYKYKGHGKRH